MAVIRTDQWLIDLSQKPEKLLEKISSYFSDGTNAEIYDYLVWHGMCRFPWKHACRIVKKWQERKIWQLVQDEERILKKMWNGPDVPVFILPADMNNPKLLKEQNGKSGLAFKDKLFLFIAGHHVEDEIRALFTHEYNHVCRLKHRKMDVRNYVLLDSVIMEGMAENAVRERIGKKFLAGWTSIYSEIQLRRLWEKIIYPNRNIPRADRRHDVLLYGLRFYPKMAGYAAGYYLVKKYMEEKNKTISDLLSLDSEEIAQIKQ